MPTGGCLCGAVRFRIAAEPIVRRTCWCRVCQYIGAGGATVNAIFPADALSVEGELSDYVSLADSGARMHRRFCPACATHLFGASESTPNLVVIRVGALDDPDSVPPTSTIWARSAPNWACIDPSLPQVEAQPPAVRS